MTVGARRRLDRAGSGGLVQARPATVRRRPAPRPYVRRLVAGLAAAACAGTLASGGSSAYADAVAPDLPAWHPGDACVGPSPSVVDSPSLALRWMDPLPAWPLTRGAGVVVAVVDTGVSARANALSGGAVLPGVDVVSGGPADADCVGRGTALAGIVAARPQSGSGLVGIAPAATVLPIRVIDSTGHVGSGALAKGVRAATAAGAGVILVGFGSVTPDADLSAAVRAALARDIVIVAAIADRSAQGNDRDTVVWYPAADDQVLAIGGVDAAGAPTEAAPPSAGLDLLAPVSEAYSVAPAGAGHYRVGGPAVAAAQVAGVVALIRAYRPGLHQDEVRRRLVQTAQTAPGRAGPGVVDAYAAVTALRTEPEFVVERPPPVVVLPRRAPTPTPTVLAAAFAIALVTVAVLAFVVATALRRGRRRNWRS